MMALGTETCSEKSKMYAFTMNVVSILTIGRAMADMKYGQIKI
jgi:hypothetical protein